MARTRPLTYQTNESTVVGARAAAGVAATPTTSVATTAMTVAILTFLPPREPRNCARQNRSWLPPRLNAQHR